MQGKLDSLGLMTNIDNVGRKHFVFYLNGEAKKHYKTRKSCNRQIEILYTNNIQNLKNETKKD